MAMHRALCTSHLSAASRRSWSSATTIALAILLGACSAGDADPAPSFSGGQTSPGSGGSGSANAPSVSPGSTSNNSTNTNTPSTNQQTASNANNSESLPTNLPQTNGSAGSGSSSNNTNNNTNSGTQGSGGAGGAGNNTASGGSAGSASTMGAAGGSTMPPTGAAGTSGNGSAGAGGNTQPPADTTPDIPCPDGATFCSGFEGTTLPAGAAFEPSYLMPGFGKQVLFDNTQAHSGKQSLFMPSDSSLNYYRMLSVAVPGNNFWVRVYMRSDVGLGAPGSTHASVYMGSIVPQGGDYNGDQAVELSEQFGQVLLNSKDDLYQTAGHGPLSQATGTTLPSNTWVCLETQFDGDSGNVLVFADGQQLINAQAWKKLTYKTFRFGYLRYDSPVRNVWLDDVVVSSSRVGCQ